MIFTGEIQKMNVGSISAFSSCSIQMYL